MGRAKQQRHLVVLLAAMLGAAALMGLPRFGYRFAQAMAWSHGAEGISGPMPFSERIVYSFVLAAEARH